MMTDLIFVGFQHILPTEHSKGKTGIVCFLSLLQASPTPLHGLSTNSCIMWPFIVREPASMPKGGQILSTHQWQLKYNANIFFSTPQKGY